MTLTDGLIALCIATLLLFLYKRPHPAAPQRADALKRGAAAQTQNRQPDIYRAVDFAVE